MSDWAFVSRGLFADIHVIPVNDLITHTDSVLCLCRPRVEPMMLSRMVTHNAADGREYFEDDGPSSTDNETVQ